MVFVCRSEAAWWEKACVSEGNQPHRVLFAAARKKASDLDEFADNASPTVTVLHVHVKPETRPAKDATTTTTVYPTDEIGLTCLEILVLHLSTKK